MHKYSNLTKEQVIQIMNQEGTPTKINEPVKMGSIIRLNVNVGAKYVPSSWGYKGKCLMIVSATQGLLINDYGELCESVNLTSIHEAYHMVGTHRSKLEGAFNILHQGDCEYQFTLRDCW